MTEEQQTTWASKEAMEARYAELTAAGIDGNKVLNIMWWVEQNRDAQAKAIARMSDYAAQGNQITSGQLEAVAHGATSAVIARRIELTMTHLHNTAEEFIPADEELEALRSYLTRQLLAARAGTSTSAMSNEMDRLAITDYQYLLTTIVGY